MSKIVQFEDDNGDKVCLVLDSIWKFTLVKETGALRITNLMAFSHEITDKEKAQNVFTLLKDAFTYSG